MILHSAFFVGGLVALYYGAEWLIRGSSLLALNFGIRPIVIGLTVVALGTSMPEVLVTVMAAFQDSPDVGLGNVVGSNIANIGLILGTAGLVAPMLVDKPTLTREYPVMMGFSFLLFGLALDGVVSRADGVILLAGAAAFTGWMIYSALTHKAVPAGLAAPTTPGEPGPEPDSDDTTAAQIPLSRVPTSRNLLSIAIGFVGLIGGAHLLVTGAVFLARAFGVSELVIGLTMVALGTSLPELATSLVAAARDESEICIGNVVGSNIYNIVLVLGILAAIGPLRVDPYLIKADLPIMLGFTVLLFAVLRWRLKLPRPAAVGLLVSYLIVMYYLFTRTA